MERLRFYLWCAFDIFGAACVFIGVACAYGLVTLLGKPIDGVLSTWPYDMVGWLSLMVLAVTVLALVWWLYHDRLSVLDDARFVIFAEAYLSAVDLTFHPPFLVGRLTFFTLLALLLAIAFAVKFAIRAIRSRIPW